MAQTHSLNLKRASTQYASITNAAQTGLGLTGNHTVEAWVKLDSAPGSNETFNIINKYAETGNQRGWMYRYVDVGGTKYLEVRYSTDGAGGGSVSVGQLACTLLVGVWYHLAFVYNTAGTCAVYLNGGLIGTISSMKTSIFNNTAPVTVGYNVDGAAFNGSIKDLRVFNDNRTAAEIVADARTQTVSDGNLVAEWNFNNSYEDATANNNDLTATASPVFGVSIPWEAVAGAKSDKYALRIIRASAQYASIADGSQTGLDISGDMTVEFWLNMKQLPSSVSDSYRIVCKTDGASARAFVVLFNNNVTDGFECECYRDGTTSNRRVGTSAANIVTSADVGRWVHWAATFNVGTGAWLLYKDGVPLAVTTNNAGTVSSIYNSSAPLSVGAQYTGSAASGHLDGLIRGVRIFNDIRTQAEIIADALAATVSNANLKAEWSLDNVYTDASGNSNTLTAAGSPVFKQGANNITGANIVEWWTMDETSGTRVGSHNSVDLADNNTVLYAAGKKSNAADFEAGNSEFLSKADAADLEIPRDFSFQGWFNFESFPGSGSRMYLANRDPDDNANRVWAFALFNDGGTHKISAYNSSGGGNATTTGQVIVPLLSNLSTATWYHIAVNFRNGNLEVYVNGAYQGTASGLNTTMYTSGTSQLTIGAYDTGVSSFYDGLLDETSLYSKFLTYGEVLDIYNLGNAITYLGVQTYNQAVTATVAVTSAIIKQMSKTLTATTTPSASVIKQMSKTLTATTTPSASVIKQMAKSLVANTTATASMLKQMSKTLIATASVTASMTAMKVFLQDLVATVSVTANMVKTPGKLLTATASVTADIAKSLALTRTLVATANVTGVVLKGMSKTLIAATNVTAVITKTPGKLMQATANVTASVAKQIEKVLVATTTISATIQAGRAVIMIATATVAASITKTPGKLMTAIVSIVAKVSAPFWRTKYPAHGDGDDYEIKYPHE